MSDKSQDPPSTAMSLGDVYFILFRHKWMILFFSFAGILGAILLLFVVKPPQYQSEAMLSILYVVDGKSLNPPGDEQSARPLNEGSESIINTELAILHSLDVAKQVVQAMTPERILAKAGGGADINRAAFLVSKGLTVETIPDSSIIRIVFQNPDPKLVQPVLSEIIDAYFTKHVQMHRGMVVSDYFLTNETARLRAEYALTDDELEKLKRAAGVISVGDTQKAYADQISKIHQDLFSAEVELSGHQAMLGELTKSLGTKPETTNVDLAMEVSPEGIDNYERVCAKLTFLEGKEQDYLTQQGFTEENVLVKQVHEQIEQNEALKKDLEEKYPNLTALSVPLSSPTIGRQADDSINFKTESEQVTGLKAKIQTLNSQLNQVWAEATNFEKVETTISELEQKKQLEETNLKYFMGNLEETRIDAALGGDKASNISIIQAPSPPGKGWSKTLEKKAAMMAAGGVFGGLALAFLIELFLDRSVKRPTDIETKLRLPLFISIPAMARNGHRHLTTSGNHFRLKDTGDDERETAEKKVVPHQAVGVDLQNRQHPLRRFHEGLRDRLIVYFETRNLTHKPKLVAVTSCGKGAGVSSIAAGLAASLSETGDGNVLLVNISGEQGAAQQFYKGKPGCSLDEALAADKKQGALVKANLFTATEQADGDMLPANLPKKISTLMPKFKASEYDYIIFDMPPVSQTSVTARLAGLMDMVLLVIESEKTNQDVVKRVNQLLAESKAKVSTVLNKTRTYVPACLHQEFLNDT
jgi:succinoglycan biosynthesis transport protein ExoP